MYVCIKCIFPSVYNEGHTVNIFFIFKASPSYVILPSVYLAVIFSVFLSLSLLSLPSAPTPDLLPGRMVLGSGCVWVWIVVLSVVYPV